MILKSVKSGAETERLAPEVPTTAPDARGRPFGDGDDAP